MTECRHLVEEEWCGECRAPAPAAPTIDLEHLREVIATGDSQETLDELLAALHAVEEFPAESAYDRGGTSKKSEYRRARLTSLQVAHQGAWDQVSTEAIFVLDAHGWLDQDIARLVGHTPTAIQSRRRLFRGKLG